MAKFVELPDLEYLRQALDYNPATGKFTWLTRPVEQFASAQAANSCNSRTAGKEAFTAFAETHGYVGRIGGQQYVAHRIAFYMGTGQRPEGEIDHINGDRRDNRLANLRSVSHAINARNRARNRNSKHPAHGVYHRGSRWVAQIKVDGRPLTIGSFLTCEEAMAARVGAERVLDFHPNHGRKPRNG